MLARLSAMLPSAATFCGTNFLLFVCPSLFSAELTTSASVVEVSTAWSQNGVKPGGQIELAVTLHIRSGWHVNSHLAKAPNIPVEVELLDGPQGLTASTPLFPNPELIDFGVGAAKTRIEVFTDNVVLFIPMALAQSAVTGPANVEIRTQFQACNDAICLFPADVTNHIPLLVLTREGAVKSINEELFSAMKTYRQSVAVSFFGWDFDFDPRNLWLLFALAGLGGFLLNFTPCVLPMVPIKVMSLSRVAGNRARSATLGISMSIGVIVFWLGLAGAIISFSGFKAANQLFQYPAFAVSIGVIIIVMAMGMCGLFTLNPPAWLYRFNPSQESIPGSFGFGIMTAILSTPCTAPFMGAAAAWATTQRPLITLSTFVCIGIGMALPYLVLSIFPFLVKRVPRTGPASDLIKQVMGLLLFAAGAYFVGAGVAGITSKPPDPPSALYWWAVAFFISSAGLWLAWRTLRIATRLAPRASFAMLGLAMAAIGIWVGIRFTQHSPIQWTYFTPARLLKAHQNRKVVVLEFTAAWCLNCQALEQAVLHDARVVELLNDPAVAPIKVDITGNNPAGNQKLVEVGRRTIPYLVIYGSDGRELFASDAYTATQLLNVLRVAMGNREPLNSPSE
jgi:thiol:disulfide interchange protein